MRGRVLSVVGFAALLGCSYYKAPIITDGGFILNPEAAPISYDGDPGDAGEQAWLTPMNAARAAVGESPLTWNVTAAEVAQAWASQCNFEHNPDRTTQYDAMGGSGALGENIAAGYPTETPAAGIQSWIAEEANYDHATNSCAAGATCGHYTQIVWKTTTSVGCAHVTCDMNSPFGGEPWDINVCDFSPAGNITGEAPY